MNSIYMHLTITHYNNKNVPSDLTFYQAVDDEPMTCRKLTLAEAQRLQWELVKAGAKRTIAPNMYTNSISNVEVSYFMRH